MPIIKKNLKQSLALMLLLASCSTYTLAIAETTPPAEAHHAEDSLDWPGIYLGFLPCADCEGIKTTLALNKNNSYLLITQHVGKSEREFVEKGKFSPGEKSNTIVLTPRNNGEPRRFLVGEDKLMQLDNNGNHIVSKLADRYTLRRKAMQQSEHSTSHH